MTTITGWYVRSNRHNKELFPELVGQTIKNRPDGPLVSPVIRCECGDEVLCEDFTNTCDRCGADYNFNGSLLAPRSQWGEETGERWQDCY
jgi:hypothetical protein